MSIQNLVPSNPEWNDVFDLIKKEVLLDLCCHHVGTIQSFNPTLQTAVASVNYTQTFLQLNKVTNQYVPVQVNYPTLIDCPVIVLGGGPAHITFPIAKGDECLLIFNDRDIDNWFSTGQFGPGVTGRLHAFSDAFILVGVKSTPKVLSAYDSIRALITNGTTKVGINPQTNKITLTNGTTLNSQLQNLCTELQNLVTAIAAITVTTAGVPSTVPVNAAAITAIGTQISATAALIGGILE